MTQRTPPLQVFRSIQVIGKRFGIRGNLSYLRTHYKGYDLKKGDDLDAMIYEEIKKVPFEDSYPPQYQILFYDEQLVDIKRSIQAPYKQTFQLLICGTVTINQFKKNPVQLCRPINLKLRYFHLKSNHDEIIKSYINSLGLIVYLNVQDPQAISQSIMKF